MGRSRDQRGDHYGHRQDAQKSSCSFHQVLLLASLLPLRAVILSVKQQKQRGAPPCRELPRCETGLPGQKGALALDGLRRPGCSFFPLGFKTDSVFSEHSLFVLNRGRPKLLFRGEICGLPRGLSGARKRLITRLAFVLAFAVSTKIPFHTILIFDLPGLSGLIFCMVL